MEGCATRRLAVGGLCLLCACASVKPEGPIIDDLELEGVKSVSARDLKKRVLTSESLLPWLPFFGREEHFDANAWAADQRRIERYYQAHGFYNARVTEEEPPQEKDGHISLKLKVTEGQPTVVTRFDVKGLETLSESQRKTVLDKLPGKVGETFLEDEWLEAQRLLAQRLQKLGFAGATLQAQAKVDVGTNIAELDVTATVGQRYKFGRTYVANPDGKVNPRLISDQVESVIEEGDWFTPEALEEAQARVFQMGVFSAVKVNRSALDQASGTVPVTVDVREAPFHSWRVGGGVGGDPLRNEVRTSALYENRNFLGGTRRLTLRARAGYAALAGSSSSGAFLAFLSVAQGARGSQHGPFGRLTAEVEQPHFLTRAFALQFALEPSYQLEPAYRAGGGSSRLSLVWRPTSHFTAAASYNASYYRLSTPVNLGSSTTTFVGCGIDCVLEYFEETAAWDRRDDPLEPHDGWYLALGTQQGGNTLANGGFLFFNFFRFLPEARGYVSWADKRFTLSARARLGLMFSRAGSAPIPVRFFSGGNDMRGFSSRRLAPYEVVPRTDCNDFALDAVTAKTGSCPGYGEVLPVGGNTLLDGSFEFRWNVVGPLTIATFMDLGFVTQDAVSVELLTSLNVALGFGIRYRTPIGPIRLDLAARLPWVGAPLQEAGRVLPHAVSRGCFLGLGAGGTDAYPGSPEGQCAFHLSIGEAF